MGRAFAFGRILEGEAQGDFLELVGGVAAGEADSGDARVLPVAYRAGDGRRERTWQEPTVPATAAAKGLGRTSASLSARRSLRTLASAAS